MTKLINLKLTQKPTFSQIAKADNLCLTALVVKNFMSNKKGIRA